MLLVYYNPSTNVVETRAISLEDIGNTDRDSIASWYLHTFSGNVLRIDNWTVLIHL